VATNKRAKRDRERARQEKAALKRARRQSDGMTEENGEEIVDEVPTGPRMPQSDVLAELAALHQRFEDGDIKLDDFEDAKSDLIGQLDV